MSHQYDTENPSRPTAEEESQFWAEQLERYLRPYSERLDAYLDRRVVGNLTGLIGSLVQQRGEVTLTTLGSGLTGPDHVQAGIGRLDRALHHSDWTAQIIEKVMWEEAVKAVKAMSIRGITPIVIMDSSCLEKPESQQIVGKSVVRSSKGRRLTRYRSHIYNPVSVPIRVPGYEWECLILLNDQGHPQVIATRWWKRDKGVSGQQQRHQMAFLQEAKGRLGSQVVWVLDRGYGHGPGLRAQWQAKTRFVMRWKKKNKLIDEQGRERKAWEINRGKRAWGEARPLWDWQHRHLRDTHVLAFWVRHPDSPDPLWLVVVRQGQGNEPWYLLTNEPVLTADDAWRIVFLYARRWKIEEYFRVEKSELRLETIRLQDLESQNKLLLLVTLACGFLFSLLCPALQQDRARLLKRWCQRSDWRLAQTKLPVYRLRWALSTLWSRSPPCFSACVPYRAPSHLTWPVGSLKWWMTLWNRLDRFVERVC